MIKFYKLSPKTIAPTPTPSGFDLHAPERVDLPPGQSYTIGSGLGVTIPKGYVGMLHARSQMALKTNIRVGAQILHYDFKGELQINLNNNGKDLIEIKPNDPVAQLVIVPCLLDYEIYDKFI